MSEPGAEKAARRDEVLGAILTEVIDRRRRGESPSPGEYVLKHPHLRDEIEAHFETIALLEGDPAPPGDPADAAAPPLGEAIARLPHLLQQVIFFRNFRRRRWDEIARLLGQPEMELRRGYARAIRALMDRPGEAPAAPRPPVGGSVQG